MDVIEDYEAFTKDPTTWNRIEAIAFSCNWDAHKISQQIFRAWKEGRVFDSISSIMDECENNSTSLVINSDNPASEIRPRVSSEGKDEDNLMSSAGSLGGTSLNTVPLGLLEIADSVPAADVSDHVPIVEVNDNTPIVEASGNSPTAAVSKNVPIVVASDSVPNTEVSDSAANDRVGRDAVHSAALSRSAPNEVASSSAVPSLHEQVRALQNENRLLVKQIMCLSCSAAERDSLFMPCGHFIMCSSCSDKCSVCPLCSVTILATSRTRL